MPYGPAGRDLTAVGFFLLVCLFLGLPAGGLRSRWLWTVFAAAIWTLALAKPAPSCSSRLKPWLGWLVWAVLSVAACEQPWKGLYALSRWMSAIAFFCLAAAHWDERDFRRWLAGLSAACFALGLGALLIKGEVHPMTGLIPPYYNYTIFVEAAFAAAAGAYVAHPRGAKGRQRWLLSALLIFALALILKARSRSGLVAVTAASLVWMILHGKRRQLFVALLTAATAAALLPASAWAFLLKLDMAEWFTRPPIWTAALKVLADHPLLGEGLGNFEQGFMRHNFPTFWATNYGFATNYAHSEPLHIAAETGWIGLTLFLTAIFASLHIRSPRQTTGTPLGPAAQPLGPAQEAGICALTAMAVQCTIDNMLHIPALAMLFLSAMLWAGRVLTTNGGGTSSPYGSEGPPALWRGFCLFGLSLCLVGWIPEWLVGRYWDLHRKEDDPVARIGLMQKAIAVFPADYYLHETLARNWLALQPPQTPKAEAELEEARRLNSTNALYPAMQAEISAQRGHRQKALDQLNVALALEPNFLTARTLRAKLWAQAKNKKAARHELAEILKRRALLKSMPLYSNYDRTVVFFDPRHFEAAAALVR